LCDKRTLKIHS